ncbi:MAG: sugar ABC transporter permease, partial [Propionibacteriaceae bacterium]|nr:sugar ABC transporter permease [Propionibacteriaceae bacterium]
MSALTLELSADRLAVRRRRRWRNAGWVLLFLAPSALPLLVFKLAPMVASAWVSLHRWNMIGSMSWAGLDNYRDLLTSANTWQVFGHTLLYVVGYLPLVYGGGLLIAVALNQKLRARGFLRAAYFVPVVTSWVAVALVWQWLLNPSRGLVNHLLGLLHL